MREGEGLGEGAGREDNRSYFCFKAARARINTPRAWAACSLASPAHALAGRPFHAFLRDAFH
jgi:hypothetical protein